MKSINLPETVKDAIFVIIILAGSLVVRISLFVGVFGSDDVVYLERSLDVARGEWGRADYNGALRYGYNIPAGFLIYVFGLSEFNANLWTLICSTVEIFLVYLFAMKLWGRREAIIVSILLSTAPLHIIQSTSIHTDSVLSCFITLSYVLFFFAEKRRSVYLYFFSGICLGMIFWIKELAAVVFVGFATYCLFERRFDRRWFWIIGGGGVMLIAHLGLMQIIAGDVLHAVKTVIGQMQRNFIDARQGEDSPFFYLKYLFFDVRHSWLMGLLAAIAIGTGVATRERIPNRPAFLYVVWWFVGLLLVLSFFPVSLNPLRFAMKQSNYLTIFFPSMALLGGVYLSNLTFRKTASGIVLIAATGGVVLAVLNHHSIRTFTANSRAAVEFAKQNPSAILFATKNNVNVAHAYALLAGDNQLVTRYKILSRVDNSVMRKFNISIRGNVYIVLDYATLGWGMGDVKLSEIPSCWRLVAHLNPAAVNPVSEKISAGIRSMFVYFFSTMAASINTVITIPKRAEVYQVDANHIWCTE